MIALRAQSQRKKRYIVSAGNGFHINTHRAFKYKSTKAIIKSYFVDAVTVVVMGLGIEAKMVMSLVGKRDLMILLM